MERDLYQKIIAKIKAIAEKINSISVDTESIGTLDDLTTTDKTNLVSAINEVDDHADDNAEAIGTLSNLTTTNKTDLVSALNEVDGNADDNARAIGTLSNLNTTNKTSLVDAINEVNGKPKYTEIEVTTTANGDAELFNSLKVIVLAAQKTSTDYVICLPYQYNSKTMVRCLSFSSGTYTPMAERTLTLRVWYFD